MSESGIELLDRAALHPDRIAARDRSRSLTYRELDRASRRLAGRLLEEIARHEGVSRLEDLAERRVAFLVTPSSDYVVTQWAIWRAGGLAVPLCTAHPQPELEYVIEDADASLVVASSDRSQLAASAAAALERPFLDLASCRGDSEPGEALPGDGDSVSGDTVSGDTGSGDTGPGDTGSGRAGAPPLPRIVASRRAMIVYTSGTTGRPKGVVTTHGNVAAQVTALVEAWRWRPDDAILSVLPLHHVHGIVNVVCCALWSGARVDFLESFDAEESWRRIASGDLTLFMAVPTIYSKLLEACENGGSEVERWVAGARSLRLMVSGSAALPVSLLERWQELTGHRLLERYGMSETGMILSNPLYGERLAGSVGAPLPGVEVRLRDGGEKNQRGALEGELEVRGPAVFSEYWRRPNETAEAFADGWFRTGDRVELEDGRYRILGRTSVDILKTGGYKVSALEIEEALRGHPSIAEVAVVGVPDEEWGERVSAAVVLAAGAELSLDELRNWTKERIAGYKAPSRLLLVDDLPRNVLGKVTKPAVRDLFSSRLGDEESEQRRG